MTGWIVLGVSLGFNNHAPEQAAVVLTFHQQATDEVGSDQLRRAGEEGLGERWWVTGKLDCYERDLGRRGFLRLA